MIGLDQILTFLFIWTHSLVCFALDGFAIVEAIAKQSHTIKFQKILAVSTFTNLELLSWHTRPSINLLIPFLLFFSSCHHSLMHQREIDHTTSEMAKSKVRYRVLFLYTRYNLYFWSIKILVTSVWDANLYNIADPVGSFLCFLMYQTNLYKVGDVCINHSLVKRLKRC